VFAILVLVAGLLAAIGALLPRVDSLFFETRSPLDRGDDKK
jgi:hypothetical protein